MSWKFQFLSKFSVFRIDDSYLMAITWLIFDLELIFNLKYVSEIPLKMSCRQKIIHFGDLAKKGGQYDPLLLYTD